MTKSETVRSKGKGGRNRVAFVVHPDTGKPVRDLRFHKSSGLYYRIREDKKNRHNYKKQGRQGLAYLRRAIYEHECWQAGQEPGDDVIDVPVMGDPGYDSYGSPFPVIATDTRNIVQIPHDALYAYFREQLSNPATRKEFAEKVGYPELVNLQNLQAPPEPLTLQEIIDRYISDKNFATTRQAKDAQTVWELFVDTVQVDTFDEISNDQLTRYRQVVENEYALRTQRNHYNIVQSILTNAADVFKEHRTALDELKAEIQRNCQRASQDKRIKARKGGAKAMKPQQFRKLLTAAQEHSKLAHALFLSAANFALHGKEACDLRHDDIDLDSLELHSTRNKDGVERVAIIWRETAKAIKKFLASDECQHHPEFLFVNGDGKPMNIYKLNRLLVKLRSAARLPTVTFDGIRKMTRTAMGTENIIAIKWVMGHIVSGEDDTYAERSPKETRQALAKAHDAILREK